MSFHAILQSVQAHDSSIESSHYFSDIVLLGLPDIADALSMTRDLIMGPPVKLPLTSVHLETLKGIAVRNGKNVSEILVHLRHGSAKPVSLKLVEPIVLPQLVDAVRAIEDALAAVRIVPSLSSGECITRLSALLSHVDRAKSLLQLPTDPLLVFPKHVCPAHAFSPPLENLLVDLYVTRAELCLDIKCLHPVTERGWGDFDPTSGRAYIDIIRDEMSSQQKNALSPQNVEKRMAQLVSGKAPSNSLLAVLSQFTHKLDPLDYITRGTVYDRHVVLIEGKAQVSSPDAALVSALTKLDSVAYMISIFIDNLKALAEY